MSRKEKSKILKGGGVYKPLIASSLAIALGVSVASGAALAEITGSTQTVSANIDAPTTITGGDHVGGLIIAPATTTEVTLGTDVTISGITTSTANANAYGIYVSGAAVANTTVIKGAHTITLSALPTAGTNGTAYIYANAGQGLVTFQEGAKIIAGAGTGKPTSGQYGIHSGITANYAFGSAGTSFVGTNAATAADASIIGLNIKDDAAAGITTSVSGVLNVTAGNANTNTVNGGNATGIVIDTDTAGKDILSATNLVLNVTGGNGNTDATSLGGSATGIAISGTAGADINGDIQLNLVSGKKGDQSAGDGTLTAINNAMTGSTGILTFTKNSSLAVSAGAVNVGGAEYGIYNNIADVAYNFSGDADAKTVFTSVAGAENGGKAAGIIVKQNLTHTGNLAFTEVVGGKGIAGTARATDGGKGGLAAGLVFDNATENEIIYTLGAAATNTLTFEGISGGAGGDAARAAGVGGDAYGIIAQNGKSKLSIGSGAVVNMSIKGGAGGEAIGIFVKTNKTTGGTNKTAPAKTEFALDGAIKLTVGDAANTTKAYGLKLEDGVFSGNLTFNNNGSNTDPKLAVKDIGGNAIYAIHSSGESEIKGGIISLVSTAFGHGATKVDKYVLFNDAQGTLTLGSGVKVKTGSTNTGIINNDIAGAIYAFGKTTELKGGDASGAKGADLIAFEVAQNAALGGTLKLVGQNAQGNAKATGDGFNGGAATGLNFADATKYTVSIDKTSGLTLDLAGGVGTAKTGGGTTDGKGGNAIGINLAANATNGAKIDGGVLTLKLAGGLDKTGGASTAETIAIQINDASTLELANDGIIVGEKATGTTLTPRSYAIYSNLNGAKYSFGAKGVTTSGNEVSSASTSGDITGMILVGETNVSGKLAVNGGNAAASSGLNGGKAVGIKLALADNTTYANLGGLNLAVTGGAGTDKSGTPAKNGNGGDAIGILVDTLSTNKIQIANSTTANIGVTEGKATSGTRGKAIGILVKAPTTSQNDVATQDVAKLTLGGTGTLNLQVGKTNTKEAYGLKLESGTFKGALAFATSKSIVTSNSTDGVSYGIHTSGNSKLESAKISFESTGLIGKTTYALYNAGNLVIDSDSEISAGAGTGTSNLYAANDKTLGVAFAAGSTTTFNGSSAFAVAGTGAINLTLENNAEKGGAKLIFNGDAGTINTLSGSNADIFLAGKDQAAVNARFEAKAPFARRTLVVKDMQLSGSHFVLAAKSDSVDQANPSIIVSDTIAATTTANGAEVFKNTLHVVVDKYVTETSDKAAVLAVVDSTKASKIIFNNLETDGRAKATAYGTFTNGDIEIVRTTEGNQTLYTSDLKTTNISVNTDFVAPATAALSAGISLFSANLNSLSKRMGELRNDPYSQGTWARVFGGEQTTNFGAKQSTVYSTVQAGYDYKLALGDAANYIGAAISYTKGMGGQVDPAYKQIETPVQIYVPGFSSSNTDGVEVALYNSYVANSGLYSDSIVKFGYYMNDLTMFGQTDAYSTSNLAVAVSEEIGYKVSLGESNEWFITPQGEVAFAYIGGTEFTQSNGADSLKSTQDAVSLLRARVGAAWGYDFSYLAKESDIKASIYLGTYYAYDYFIGGDTTLTAVEKGITSEYKHNAYEGTGRFVMNLGTNIDVQDRTKVYFDFEKSFGGNIQTDYQVSLGVRFGFGEKVSAPKQEEKKATEAALKPKELDESAE